MASFEKGSKYTAYGLDFTLINPDFDPVGKLHYVQAKCNICGKKVKMLRGQWYYDQIKSCSKCNETKKASSKEKDEIEKPSAAINKEIKKQVTNTKNTSIKPRATVKIQPKSEQKITQTTKPLLESTIQDCIVKRYEGIDAILACKQCGKEHRVPISKLATIVEPLCDCRNAEKIDLGLIQKINQDTKIKHKGEAWREIPGWVFVGEKGYTKKASETIKMYRCATCGGKVEFNTVNALKQFNGVCKKCEKLKYSKLIPLTRMDWVGFMTKCRRVESTYENDNGIKMAKVKCLICEDTEDIALASVIAGDIEVCEKCANKQLQLLCPICNKIHIKNNLKGLYSEINSDIICNNEGGKKIPKEELVQEHDFRVRMKYISSRYRNKYKFESKTDGDNEKASLIVFDSGYIGRNGIQYKNCFCAKHNRFLSLTEDEIEEYRHDFCMDFRMVPVDPKKKLK